MTKVVLLQTAIADYRNSFIKSICEHYGDQLVIMVGESYFEESTRTSEYVLSLQNTKVVKNIYLANRRLCLQLVKLQTLLVADVVVFELNPRLLTHWLVLPIRKLIGKKNVCWGHAWSRVGADSGTEVIRNFMRKLSDAKLFYTNTQKNEYINKYKIRGDNTFVAPNSLYNKVDIAPALGAAENVIYVGRLIDTKKPELLIRAFETVLNSYPDKILHMVGDGPEREKLEKLSASLNISTSVIFHGHVSDKKQLEGLYGDSLVSVSPGYVGLSITQSFAFGRPMIISKNENHSPEIEAFVESRNGKFFETNSSVALAETICDFLFHSDEWKDNFENISIDCVNRYSVERMVAGFTSAVDE